MHLLNNEMMQAICWTLIHSLWQGLLLAVCAGVVIMLTKKSSSTIRYNSLAVLFFLFIAATCFTFAKQYNYVSAHDNIGDINQIVNKHADLLIVTGNSPITNIHIAKTFLETFIDYFNEHASLIVMIWFIVLSIQLIRLMANAGYVQRIRHYKTHAPSEYWTRRMQELAVKLNIRQKVLLLQSEIVKVPVMVGFLKPVILFPFQLMSQLPAEQVEAVLLHELAHIRRKDYFVNILQNLAEIIFFFNPGVLWISSLIRDERENCCDDIAVAETKCKKEFVHALVSFQEYNLNSSRYSLAFPGRKNHLLIRVKRILTNNNKTLNNMEKISLASGIVIIGLITIAFKQTEKQDTIKEQSTANAFQSKEIKNDTVPEKKSMSRFEFNGTIDGKKYRIKEINGKVEELYVEGKKIPDEKIGDYQEMIDKLHLDAKKQQDELEKQRAELMLKEDQMKKNQDELDAQQNKRANETDIIKLKAEQEELNARMEEWNKSQALVAAEQAEIAKRDMNEQLKKQNDELMAVTHELMKRQAELKEQIKSIQQKDAKAQSQILNKQMIELKNEQLQIQQQRIRINKMLLYFNNNQSMAIPGSPVQPAVIEHDPSSFTVEAPVIVQDVEVVPPVPPVNGNKLINSIIRDLMAANLITDKDNFSFTLNSEMLEVNDVIQPEELHARLKEKYVKSRNDHVIYSKHGGSTHSEINVD
jgi:beta-lactamase regulating signal transducer with metallopeptidase domain